MSEHNSHRLDSGKRVSTLYMQDEWQPNLHYHIIGKAIPGRTLFQNVEEGMWFMKNVIRFKLYTLFHIYAYCLCGNHFHLAVKTRTASEILEQL